MSKKACVLVCVTSQPDCERLIRAGKKIADGEGVPLQVVSVQRMEECFQPNSETLERLHQQAKAVNAEMTVYFNDSPAITAAVHAVKEGAVNIVMGFPRENSARFVKNNDQSINFPAHPSRFFKMKFVHNAQKMLYDS